MKFQEEQISNNEYVFGVLESDYIVGTAFVKKMRSQEGGFWHLADLQIDLEENRGKGYGTALLTHLIDYLLETDKLRIKVHPAGGRQALGSVGQQGMEGLAMQSLSEEDLDEIDKQTQQEMQNPNFWENQGDKQDFNSERLKEWYRKRGFNIDDPDGRHLWYHPESAT